MKLVFYKIHAMILLETRFIEPRLFVWVQRDIRGWETVAWVRTLDKETFNSDHGWIQFGAVGAAPTRIMEIKH